MLLRMPLLVKKQMLIFTSAGRFVRLLCRVAVCRPIWLKSEKAKQFRKEVTFILRPPPPTSSVEQSDAWQRVTESRISAISVVKQDKLQVLLSKSPSY